MTKVSNRFKSEHTFDEILIEQDFICFPRTLHMTIPHRSFQIENPRRLPIVKQILHYENVHFHRLPCDRVL